MKKEAIKNQVKEIKQHKDKIKGTMKINKFKPNDKVEVHNNKEAIILNHYKGNMYLVRLWSGLRHVGDICVDSADIKSIERN